jgi:hypothetical protein
VVPQNQKKCCTKDKKKSNPHDDPGNFVGRCRSRGRQLMVGPDDGVFIWIGWQYVSLATVEIFGLNVQSVCYL